MIVARVNDYEISMKEYQMELADVQRKMKLEQPNDEAKKSAIERLIDGYILLESAQNQEITSDEIDEELLNFKLRFNSEEEFNKMLTKENLKINAIRENLSQTLKIRKFIAAKFEVKCEVEEDKIKAFYEKNILSLNPGNAVRASHILIKGDTEDSFSKAQEISQSLNSEEEFKKMAETCSDCPSCCQSGDLGFFTRGKMVPEFEKVAFDLQVGEISKPIKTQFGYHIIMVTEKKEAQPPKFEEIKDLLRKRLERIEAELKLINFLKEQRVKAEITVNREML